MSLARWLPCRCRCIGKEAGAAGAEKIRQTDPQPFPERALSPGAPQRALLQQQGVEAAPTGADTTRQQLASEVARWAGVIRDARISLQ
ncbi:hypothetical protein [Plastoroseomonas hellenica]|uniref:hypothetical protein n=1 Tax=Plastoroseomonas hellenica TaxID=2687306 RepID=UPI001BA9F313|nr:hypothetical protein [Plastoroseomonas hellenica]MBR0646119.1 hypothetical protein [Plastoroseomonas hellenica]